MSELWGKIWCAVVRLRGGRHRYIDGVCRCGRVKRKVKRQAKEGAA